MKTESTIAFLNGFVKTELTKSQLKEFLSNFKNVKDYVFYGNDEFKVFTSGHK